MPPGRLVNARNIRFRRGRIVPRKGQQRMNETFIHATDAKVRGIIDFQIGTRRSLYVAGPGCPNVSGSAGFYLGFADQELEELFGPAVYYDFGLQGLVMGKFGGELYLGQDNNLRKLQLVDNSFGTPPIATAGAAQDIPVFTFTGFTKISALSEVDFSGYLYIGADNGGATSKITVYDGLTFVDDLTGIRAPTVFFPWRDFLIAGFPVASNNIRVRHAGTAPGTWDTVTPAGTIAIASVAGVSYRDIAYIIDEDGRVWSYDGTTLDVTHSLPAASEATDIEVFDGYLFVSYTNGTGTALVARFDGTTWVDAHKNLSAQDATITAALTLSEYRDALWVGVTKGGAGTFAHSPQYDTSGTYVVEPPVTLTQLSKSMVY